MQMITPIQLHRAGIYSVPTQAQVKFIGPLPGSVMGFEFNKNQGSNGLYFLHPTDNKLYKFLLMGDDYSQLKNDPTADTAYEILLRNV